MPTSRRRLLRDLPLRSARPVGDGHTALVLPVVLVAALLAVACARPCS
jgi:hypothetical protein